MERAASPAYSYHVVFRHATGFCVDADDVTHDSVYCGCFQSLLCVFVDCGLDLSMSHGHLFTTCRGAPKRINWVWMGIHGTGSNLCSPCACAYSGLEIRGAMETEFGLHKGFVKMTRANLKRVWQ